MKNNLKLLVLIAFLYLFLPHLKAEEYLPQLDAEATVSMDLQEASLKDVLKIFSVQSGLNFIASEAVQDKKITLYLEKVPIKEAMEKLFKANNFAYEFDESAGIFIVKEAVKPSVELVTKIFFLKNTSVSSSSMREEMAGQLASCSSSGSGAVEGKWAKEKEVGITNIIKRVLSKDGSVIEDFRTNSLVITDIPSRMPFIAQVIASLDIPIAQVMLEVEMLDVSKNAVDQLGVNWPQAVAKLDVTGARVTSFPFWGNKFKDYGESLAPAETAGGWENVSWPGKQWGPSILTVIGAELTLDFLRTQTDTKTLARPRLLTLNNETAEIKITTNEVIGETITYDDTDKSITARSAERSITGVSLRITPQVNLETGEITMFLYPSVKEANPSAFNSAVYRDPEERGTKSLVKVKDGETVIVGGLIRTEYTNEEAKLPILSDIPFLGALFRHKNTSRNKQRELLVFITPHIVKDKNITPAKIKKIALISQDPDFERKAAVNTSLNGFEKIW